MIDTIEFSAAGEFGHAGLPCTLFKRPDGRQQIIQMRNIYLNDYTWLKENNVILAAEEVFNDFVVYFDYGAKGEDGSPDEYLILAMGRSCQETFKAAVIDIMKLKAGPNG